MHRRTAITALAGGAATALFGEVPAFADAGGHHRGARPLIIAHRGAWGYRPEHTLDGYRLGYHLGADIIKTDVVCTKDGVLVARNTPELSGSTDVAAHPEFAARRTTKLLDGVATTGWFVEDFTLAEVRTLRAVESIPAIRPANTRFNGMFPIPTTQEVIDLARAESRRRGRPVGIAPDIKRPTYFRNLGLGLEERFVRLLCRNGLHHRGADVLVTPQSFEPSCLQRLNRLVDLPLVQLVDEVGKPYDFVVAGDPRGYTDLVKPDGLRFVRRYADVVSVNKDLIIPRDATAHLLAPTTLVHDAHRAGLTVHAWRFCDENTFLPADYRLGTDPNVHGDFIAEDRRFFRTGIDVIITDFPDAAAQARAGCRLD
jgi:glycerophosphoryl diester phosphodiesterase